MITSNKTLGISATNTDIYEYLRIFSDISRSKEDFIQAYLYGVLGQYPAIVSVLWLCLHWRLFLCTAINASFLHFTHLLSFKYFNQALFQPFLLIFFS